MILKVKKGMSTKERANINKRQQEFYDTKKKNFPTRIWSFFRNGLLNRIKKNIQVEREMYDLHRKWFGDLSEKKVLDLGCYEGNSLSYYLAQNSRSYLGIDLSQSGIESLKKRLIGIPGASARVVDFLSDQFEDRDFDLIYAYGVLHHFQNVDELIVTLEGKLSPAGTIISYDPLQTSLPIKILRSLYRPFQSDREWEWPFNKETYYKFERAFEIKEKRAVLGKTKWASFLNFLPISDDKKMERATKWHREDWENSAVNDEYMFGCMHLSMLMKKRT